MATHTVVIGCGETARAAALTRAVKANGLPEVTALWPLDQALIAGQSPDTSVIVVDGYPPAEVLRSIADLTDDRPELSVLVVGPLQPNMDVLVALASGAFGYLPSGSSAPAIADAVKALVAGEAVLPHAISAPLVQHLRSGGRGIVVRRWNGHDVALTNREWEVLVLLRQARSTSEIARRLVVSNGTVRTHVFALVHKFGVRDRDELALTSSASGD